MKRLYHDIKQSFHAMIRRFFFQRLPLMHSLPTLANDILIDTLFVLLELTGHPVLSLPL